MAPNGSGRTRTTVALGLITIAAMTAALTAVPAHAEGTILGADSPQAIAGHYIVTLADEPTTSSVDVRATALANRRTRVRHRHRCLLRTQHLRRTRCRGSGPCGQ